MAARKLKDGEVRRYFARVRDVEGDHPKHGKKWFRVYTHTNPSGLYGTRKQAQQALERAIENYPHGRLAGHVTDIIVERKDEPTLDTVKVDEWLTGNVVKIGDVPRKHRKQYRDTLKRAALAASRYGHKVHVNSSFRQKHEQEVLYQRYLNGGPLASFPGTSPHERGLALDIPNVRNTPALIRELRKVGLVDDVPSEIWHVTNHHRV